MGRMFSAIVALLVSSSAAHAEPVYYSWTGFAEGPSLCSAFKMTVGVGIAGDDVRGYFRQDNRMAYRFSTKMGADGSFKAEADFGPNGPVWVSGVIRDGRTNVLFDNIKYHRCACRIDALLTPTTSLAVLPKR